jgi:uncharacterized protein YsxB (DUF464 family)
LIRIEFSREEDRYKGLRVIGHSPLSKGKPGENLLCAAVSILSQTLELCLYKSGQLNLLKKEKGFLELEVVSPNFGTDVQFDFFLTGVFALGEDAAEFITIEEKGV